MMLKVLYILLSTVSTLPSASSHPARPTLPLCTEEGGKGGETKLLCIINPDQYLDFDDIRSFTASRNEQFNISINCYNGGKLRLPWPFFAKNLRTLHVSDCIIEGFLSERSIPQIYPNDLRQILLLNSKIKVSIKDLHESLFNLQDMSRDFECGHTNARVLILRNTEYVFPQFTGSLDELILLEELVSPLTVKELLSHNTLCRFEKLRYLEESGSKSFSRFHMKLMETSQYPSLETYSLRNNSLTSVPVELENMRSSFLPKLSVLDLSDNNIDRTNFLFSKGSKKKLLINLRRNSLRTISRTQLNEILNAEGVILDIRENPLDCTCHLFAYGEYLFNIPNSVIASDIYKETKCHYEQDGTKRLYSLFDKFLYHTICPLSSTSLP